MASSLRIVLDAMGGDGAPDIPVAGALDALRRADPELEVVLVGDPDAVGEALGRHGGAAAERISVLPAAETILPDEPPALAVRRKRDSSIVRGLEALRGGEADAFVSAGSTGAVLAASLFILKPLPGVDRPCVGAMFPTSDLPILVLDAGAVVDARPEHLRQWAHLGAIYVRDMRGVDSPRIGLLNVGEEEEKGNELAQAAHRLLREDAALNFVGNVEGHQIIRGPCDVLVCDGFVGNALLKFYESIAGFILGLLEKRLSRKRGELEEIFQFLDYTEYGGAPLLGVQGVSIICHGSSPPRAIENAIAVAADAVRSGMVDDLARALGRLPAPAARR